MKKVINILIITLFVFSLQAQIDIPEMPSEGPAPKIHLGKPKTFTLKNGLQVMVVENHKLPRVYAKLTIDNPPVKLGDVVGVEELLGQLFGSGSKNHSKDEFNEEVDFMGSRVFFSSNYFYLNSLSRFFPKTFELAVDQILFPAFSEEELQKEKDKMIEGIKSGEKDVATAAEHLKAKVAYGKDHPFSEFATEKSVSNVKLMDIQIYYDIYYRPSNAYLIIVGDVSFDEVKKMVTDALKVWKKGSEKFPMPPEIEDVDSPIIAFVDMPNAVQSDVSVVHSSSLRKTNDDYFAAMIANNILGGDFNSYLNMNLREEHGWTYGARSGLSSYKYGGLFSTYVNVRNEVTDSTVVETLNQINKIIDQKADPDQVKVVKAGYAGKFVMAMENPETVARYALTIKKDNLPEDFYENYLTNLESVTLDEIQAAAKKYYNPDKAKILVVGKAVEVLPALEKLNIPIQYFDKYGNSTQKPDLNKKLPEGISKEQVLDAYFKAMGGKEVMEKIKSIQYSGDISMQGMTINMLTKAAKPNKFYNKVTMMGNTLNLIAFDGEKGFMETQGQKKDLDPKILKELKDGTQPFEVMGLYEKGELGSLETIDDVEYYTITKGSSIYYFDKNTGLLNREIATEEVKGEVMQQSKVYSNYQKTDAGILFPMSIKQNMGPQMMELIIKEVIVDPDFKDSDFQ